MSAVTALPVARADRAPDVLAGRGAAAGLAADAGRDVAVFCDPAVAGLADALCAARRGGGTAARYEVVRAPTLDDVAAAGAWLAEVRPRAVLAVGGGRVQDLAKLAGVVAAAPGTERVLRGLAARAGWARLPASVPAGPPVLAVPTTLGTGAEVSAVAVVDDGAGERTLVSSPALRPARAALDPVATATLPARLVREGALEALLRVAGPEVSTPSSLRIARAEALGLAAQLAGALDECAAADGDPDDDLRLFIAQLSSATHRGWALAGRSPFPSPLWFVATELSVVLGCTKVTACALLLPAWLKRATRCGGAWGDARRTGAVLGAIGAEGVGDVAALLERWGVAPELERSAGGGTDVAAAVAARAARRWGGRLPMLGRFSAGDLAGVVGDALATWAPARALAEVA